MADQSTKKKLSSWVSDPAAAWSASGKKEVDLLGGSGYSVPDITDPIGDLNPATYIKEYAGYLEEKLSVNENHPEPVSKNSEALTNKNGTFHDKTKPIPATLNDANSKGKIYADTSQNNVTGVSDRKGSASTNTSFKNFAEGVPASEMLRDVAGRDPVPRPGQPSNYIDYYTEPDSAGTLVVKSTLEMLKKNNMYHPSPDSPFYLGNSLNEEDATKGLFTIQRELGRFVRAKDAETSPDFDGSGQRVKVSDMAAVAMSLLARAVGDHKAAAIISQTSEIGSGVVNAALRSLTEQMALQGVDIADLQLNSIVPEGNEARKRIFAAATGNGGFISDDSLNGELGLRGLPPNNDGRPPFTSRPYNSVSHGQLNSFMEPFGSGLLSSIGMLTIAVVSILALFVVGIVIEAIASNIGGVGRDKSAFNPTSPELLAYGRHEKVNTWATTLDFVLRDLLRIPKTDYDFGDALGGGISLMLGLPGNIISRGTASMTLSDMSQIQSFAINLLTNPGYYANYVRQIVMSAQQVIAAFAKLSSSSPTFAAESFFAAIQKLTSSKVYQFLMISAAVGDANLKSLFGQSTVADNERLFNLKAAGAGEIYPGQILPPQPAGSNTFSEDGVENYRSWARLRQNVSRWGGNSKNPLSISTYLATRVSDAALAPQSSFRNFDASRETIDALERALDAEYVPFYFHDLRTNEIISMPAFIVSFSDSFAPSYNSVTSYGRQDPVRIYQNTERSIHINFKLVPFGEQDFDTVWYTVNKLITMCYPQYSRGATRKLQLADNKYVQFEQPFSQVPAASPMIRIRLGELFRSNYTSSGIRRLFGVGTEEGFGVGLDQDTIKPLAASAMAKREVDINTKLTKKLSELSEKPSNDPDRLKSSMITWSKRSVYTLQEGAAVTPLGDTGATPAIAAGFTELQSTGFRLKAGYILRPVDLSAAPTTDEKTVSATFHIVGSSNKKIPLYRVRLTGVPIDDFVLDPDKIRSDIDAAEPMPASNNGLTPDDINRTVDNFFDPKSNAVVRSFESTKGKGLAGFITSLELDYGESPWETTPGSRAPKSVEISMDFAPIHDLPLGLDYEGKMRAASHPVGNIMKNFGEPIENNSDAYNDFIDKLANSVKSGKDIKG